MKLTAILTGLAVCSAAAANPASNPVLSAKVVHDSRTAGRIVICRYVEANIRYEIVSDGEECAATLDRTTAPQAPRLATLRPVTDK